MFLSFLLFGTAWFWAASIIPFILLIWLVETEKSFLALLTIILTAAVFFCFGDRAFWLHLISNPLNIIEFAGVYIGAGIVWGFIKWYFYVLRASDRYSKALHDWADTVNKQAQNGVDPKYRLQKPVVKDYQPRALKNKGRIVFWMSYWPASAVWTILNDPLTRLFNMIYGRLIKVFEKMSDSVFSKFAQEQ